MRHKRWYLSLFVSIIATFVGAVLFAVGLGQHWQPAWDCMVATSFSIDSWQFCLTIDGIGYQTLLGFVTFAAGFSYFITQLFSSSTAATKTYQLTGREIDIYRSELIKRVQRIWIIDYLDRSLYQDVLMSLKLKWDAADLPAHPFGVTFERRTDLPELALSAGTPVATFYEQVGYRLLILGAPGAGKTTLMLDLARTYLQHAMNDRNACVPVIFSLSSWPGKPTPIYEWLISEIRLRYGSDIKEAVARHWLDHNEIAPFFDGLDEMPEARRHDAVRALEDFFDSAMARWFVVCSRSEEYDSLAANGKGFGQVDAIRIKPLDYTQVFGYLAEMNGDRPLKLLSVISSDPIAQELARTPLMLNVMLLVSDAIDWSGLNADLDADILRNDLYDAYVVRALSRPRMDNPFAPRDTISWLQWLAHQLAARGQTMLLMDTMNYTWYNHSWQRYLWPPVFWFVTGLALNIDILWTISFAIVLTGWSTKLENAFLNYSVREVWQAMRSGMVFVSLILIYIATVLIIVSGQSLLPIVIFIWLAGLLLSGGSFVIQHYALRPILAMDGSIPVRYAQFLNFSTDRILLRRVGNGFMFIHGTFRDYFAALTPEGIEDLARRIEARRA